MTTALGYIVPEFPAQTHIFFWREIRELRRMGVEPRFISTRRPNRAIQSHDWSAEAAARTLYLFPPEVRLVLLGLGALLRAGPAGWGRVAATLRRDVQGSLARRIALAMTGAMLSGVARRDGLEHVHVHSCADAALVAMFAHRLSGLSYSISLHGPLRDYGPNQPVKWRHARFAVVITRAILAEVREMLAGNLPPVVELAPMGVDLATFGREAPYAPWTGDGPARVVSVGRLNRVKGHQELIEAVRLARADGLDLHLTICGEDEQGGTGFRRTLQAQIDAAGLGDAVQLTGAVSEARVLAEIERAHVFALASHAEPLGVAIMEAMAMAIPVVATDAGGVPELVDSGRDGVLVPPRAPEALAAALTDLLRDPEAALRLSRAARAKIAAEFHSGLSAAAILRNLPGAAPDPAQTAGHPGTAAHPAAGEAL
jgi:glycosyltransferase involved in cell wall biosynthesis